MKSVAGGKRAWGSEDELRSWEGAAVCLGLSQRADNTEAGGGLAGVGATEAPGMGVM